MIFFTIYFMASLFVSPHYVYRTGIDPRFRGDDSIFAETGRQQKSGFLFTELDSSFLKLIESFLTLPYKLNFVSELVNTYRNSNLFRKTVCRLRVQGPWLSTKKDKGRPDKGKSVFLNEYLFRRTEKQQPAFPFIQTALSQMGINQVGRQELVKIRTALAEAGIKQDQKITSQKSKMSTKTKKPRSQQAKRRLAKEDALPKDYDKAKKSKEELVEEFEKHLIYLKQTCEIKEDKKEFLKTQLNSFDDFLKTGLKDPNMDYTLQLLFSDITSVIKEMNSYTLDLDTFSRLYRMLYNLSENREITSYPDYWAQVIAQSIECIQ
ncbi:MAG: hypothetical protein OXM55_03000 [Bdellovibrionales bacterium]|nr:hypothetical protein [Bdellovibrionales bacterium]